MDDEIQVFAIAQFMIGGSIPRDQTLSAEQADVIAANAIVLARALLKQPAMKAAFSASSPAPDGR